MKRFLFQILFLTAASPSAFGQASADLLQRIQAHMREYLAHLPNYTCRVTVARSSRPGMNRPFDLNDRIRMEVEFAGGTELYSWPGEERFEQSLDKLMVDVPGMISIGSYALLTRALFTTEAAEFSAVREADCEGKPCLEMNFRVPIERTDYIVADEQKSAPASYSGTVAFDRDTLDLRQARMHSDQVPRAIKIARTEETTVYATARIGESDVVLPRSSETVGTRRDGTQNRNVATFENCRRFAGQSTISFEDAQHDIASSQTRREIQLPQSFDLEMTLDAPIGSDAAIGDLFTGTIRQVKSKPPASVPTGAQVTGRISNLLYVRSLGGSSPESLIFDSWLLAAKLLKIEWAGGRSEITGTLQNIRSMPPVFLTQRPASDLERILKTFGFPIDANLLRVRAKQVKIPAGFHMTWRAERLAK